MSNNWFNFLSNFGASFNEHHEVNFNQTNTTSLDGELFLSDLSWLGLIEVSGEDKHTFLQGQLTNDINAISSTLSHLSGLCTPKGRLKALFSIFSSKFFSNTLASPEENPPAGSSATEKLYLQLPLSLLEENLKRLKMFILMSKVELKDVSGELIKIGVYGSKAEKHLKALGFSIPKDVNMCSDNNNILLIRLAGKTPRFECVGSFELIKKLWTQLSQAQSALKQPVRFLDTVQWKLLDIHAGIPNVLPQTKETFIPQMLNLQILNGINFKKGCYTGQEVVARMHYLGKLKRHMYLAHCDTEKIPLPGSSLYSSSSKSAQGAGNIVDAQRGLSGGVDILAVITTEAIENNDVFLDKEMLCPLTIKELPYSLSTQE